MEIVAEYIEEHTGHTLSELQIGNDIEIIFTPESNSYTVFIHDEFFGEYETYDIHDLAEDVNYILRESMV